MDWPDYDSRLWKLLVKNAKQAEIKTPPAPILGSDRDAGAIEAARANAARAGVGDVIEWSRRAISDLSAPAGPGWVVTNPPYGRRISEHHDLRNLYARFGQVLRLRCPGWRLAMLVGDPRLEHATGLTFDAERLPLVNGGLRVHLAQATLPTVDE
jgi:putative N6-adenine-specific DNA methylase